MISGYRSRVVVDRKGHSTRIRSIAADFLHRTGLGWLGQQRSQRREEWTVGMIARKLVFDTGAGCRQMRFERGNFHVWRRAGHKLQQEREVIR